MASEIEDSREEEIIVAALSRMLATCPGFVGALVATADGFSVAQVFKKSVAESTLAAITSSIMSLAEAMANEANQGACHNVVVEGEDGSIVSLRINERRVLTVIASTQASLGMILFATRNCVEQLTLQIGE